MKRNTIIIIIVVVVLLLIGIGVYAYIKNKKDEQLVILPPGQTTPSENILESIVGLIGKLFKKKEPLPAFVQTEPIGDDGCDANGFNRIGIRCL